METKKLSLNRERIAHLSNTEMRHVIGGMAEVEEDDSSEDYDYEYEAAEASTSGATHSTVHSFTCSWCIRLSAKYKNGKPVPLNN